MKILHYVNESNLSWGRPYAQLVRRMADGGADCTVLCCAGGSLTGFMEDVGVPVATCGAPLPWCPPLCCDAGRAIGRIKPDIICTRLSSAAAIGGWWGRRLGVPVVGVLDKFSKLKYYRRVTATVAVSSELEAYAKREGFPNVSFIPNGIDTSLYRPNSAVRAKVRADFGLGDADVAVLGAGRFVDWKGFDVLIEACAGLSAVRLILAGDGEERPRYEAMCHNLGVDAHFTGFVQDIRPLMWASDVFVLPSKEPEPFGLVLLEAMSAGLSVVATRFGGPMDMIEHGKSGLLAKPGSATSLREAIVSAPSVTLDGTERAQRFDVSVIAREMCALFAALEVKS